MYMLILLIMLCLLVYIYHVVVPIFWMLNGKGAFVVNLTGIKKIKVEIKKKQGGISRVNKSSRKDLFCTLVVEDELEFYDTMSAFMYVYIV